MILVIGATGTVGTPLVGQLVDSGHAVRVLTRDFEKAGKFEAKVDVAIGDLDDEESIAKAMHGVERFFLITTSTQQDRNALAAAKRMRVGHVVKLSTQEAGWTPVQGHGHWHKEREELIRSSGLVWTFVRPCMFMDFALSWIQNIRSNDVVYSTGGEGKLGPVDPWDVAAVARTALTQPGHENVAYELTGPELLTIGDMVNMLSTVIGRPIRHVAISGTQQGEAFAKMGLPQHVVKGLVETFSLIQAGRFAYLTDDIQEVTGVLPRTFESWARQHTAAFS